MFRIRRKILRWIIRLLSRIKSRRRGKEGNDGMRTDLKWKGREGSGGSVVIESDLLSYEFDSRYYVSLLTGQWLTRSPRATISMSSSTFNWQDEIPPSILLFFIVPHWINVMSRWKLWANCDPRFIVHQAELHESDNNHWRYYLKDCFMRSKETDNRVIDVSSLIILRIIAIFSS